MSRQIFYTDGTPSRSEEDDDTPSVTAKTDVFRIDGGRTLQAFGPCDEFGDRLPGGVARVRLIYRGYGRRDGIVLAYDEACMLRDELQHATTEIEANRRAAQSAE